MANKGTVDVFAVALTLIETGESVVVSLAAGVLEGLAGPRLRIVPELTDGLLTVADTKRLGTQGF